MVARFDGAGGGAAVFQGAGAEAFQKRETQLLQVGAGRIDLLGGKFGDQLGVRRELAGLARQLASERAAGLGRQARARAHAGLDLVAESPLKGDERQAGANAGRLLVLLDGQAERLLHDDGAQRFGAGE